jgi:hypothetical protein
LTAAAVIEHVVIIFQENRSPDNLFQDPVLISRGADIASSGKNSLGQTIPLSPIDLGTTGAKPQNYDLGHSHSDFVAMYDGGKMDGANLVVCVPAARCPPTHIRIRSTCTSIQSTFNPTSLWPNNTRSATACFRPTRAPAFPLTSSSFPVLRLPQRPVHCSRPEILLRARAPPDALLLQPTPSR